jgi:hypothetical protein
MNVMSSPVLQPAMQSWQVLQLPMQYAEKGKGSVFGVRIIVKLRNCLKLHFSMDQSARRYCYDFWI